MGSIATTLLSFLILVICLFSHFFLASLAVGLPILWIILKNQLLTLLFFSPIVFLSLSPPSLPSLPSLSFLSFLPSWFYVFIHERHRESERQRHRQREKQAPCRELDVGLDPRNPGSCTQPLSQLGVFLPFLSFLFSFFLSFPLRKRERMSRGEGEEERERESQADSPAEYRAWLRAQSYDPEIMTWAKSKIQMLIRLSHLAMFACFNSTDFYFILPFLLLALLVLVS